MNLMNARTIAILAAAGLLGTASISNAGTGKMKDSSMFWEGVYAGIELGVAKPSVTNHWRSGAYLVNCIDQTNHRNRIDGVGTTVGMNIGFSFVEQDLFFGKDWMWGFEGAYIPTQVRNKTLYNNDRTLTNSEHSIYELNSIASTRGRLGIIFDNIMVVGSAGISVIDSRFGASTEDDEGDGDTGVFIDYKRVNPVLGVGVQYKATDTFSFKIMFDHYFLYQTRNTAYLGNGAGTQTGQDSYVRQNGLSTVYVGATYHFG